MDGLNPPVHTNENTLRLGTAQITKVIQLYGNLKYCSDFSKVRLYYMNPPYKFQYCNIIICMTVFY